MGPARSRDEEGRYTVGGTLLPAQWYIGTPPASQVGTPPTPPGTCRLMYVPVLQCGLDAADSYSRPAVPSSGRYSRLKHPSIAPSRNARNPLKQP